MAQGQMSQGAWQARWSQGAWQDTVIPAVGVSAAWYYRTLLQGVPLCIIISLMLLGVL